MNESDKKRFCLHFTGIQYPQCLAEVRYRDVCKQDPWRYPCMEGVTSMAAPELKCEARRWPGGDV